MVWLRKLAALLLISVGVSLVALPFPERVEGEGSREVVRLEVGTAPSTRETASARFGDAFVELDYETLEAWPGVLDSVLGLMGQSGERCVLESEWDAFVGELPPALEGGAGWVYSFRDGLYRVTEMERTTNGLGDDIVCVDIDLLGAYDNPEWGSMPRIEPGQLERYPALDAEVRRLTALPAPIENQRVDVPPREWRRFHRRLLDELEFRPSFVVFERLVIGSVGDEIVPWTLNVPWLRTACQAVGTIAILLGLGIGVAAYRAAAARAGIRVTPAWLAPFCDVILLAGGVFLVALALDTVWVGPLGQPSLLGLSPEWPSEQAITGLHFVSIPGVLIALPLLSLWFTSLSVQRLRVDEEGVTSLGALGAATLTWNDLQQVRLREQRNPFSFTVMDFRQLQRVLELEGVERVILVHEPASRKRKQQILDTLAEHAPDDKRHLLDGLEDW